MSKASLIVGNSNWAIKDSSLLGYNINDSNIYSPFPFDVTRASAATTVNKAGLIVTDEEILSGDLVTNGSFATDSDWAKGAGWSISDGKATFLNNGNGSITQSNIYEVNKNYTITFTISDYVEGSLRLLNLSNSSSHLFSGNGVYSFTDTATTTSLGLQGTFSPSNFSIDNISVVEVNRNNLARIDYSDSTKGVLLTEPQSTNLVTESQDFNDSSWDKDSGIIVSSSNNVSPSGLKDATEISVSNNGRIYINLSSANYTGSIFIKKGTFAYFKFLGVNIDLIAKTTSNANANLTEMSNGWFRIAYNIGSSSRPIQVQAYPDNTYSAHSDSGNYYIWGAQAEILPYATSIIPTSGSTVTRNQDLVTNGGEVSTFNSEEGVLFAEVAINGLHPMYIQLSDGTYNNRVSLINNNSATSWRTFYRVGGVSQIDSTASFLNAFEMNKIAISWKLNKFKFFVNGVKISEINSGVVNAANTFNSLSFSDIGNTNVFFGKTSQIQVFKKALTDAELIKLTTI